MNDLNKLYTKILCDLGFSVDKAGDVYFIASGDKQRVQVSINRDNKRVKLPMSIPTKAYMDDEVNTTRVYYHPACEGYARGQSEVLNAVIKLAGVTMLVNIQGAVDTLINLTADKDGHAKYPQAVSQLVQKMPPVSGKSLEAWRKFRGKLTGTSRPRPLLNIRLKRGDNINGTAYARTCKISVPPLDNDLFGDTITNAAKAVIMTAYNLVLGETRVNYGSNVEVAPYNDAFLNAYAEQMSRINSVYKTLSKYVTPAIPFNGKWVSELKNISNLYRDTFYVQLEGNIGLGGVDEPEEKVSTVSYTAPPKAPPTPKVVKRTPRELPTPPKKTKAFTMPTSHHPQQQPYPQPPAYPQQQPYPQPPAYPQQQPYPQPPAYPQQQPYPQPPAYPQSYGQTDQYGRPIQQPPHAMPRAKMK